MEPVNSGRLEGWVEVVTSLRGESVSAGTRERAEVPLNFELPQGAKPKNMYLDLTVSGVTDKWRVFLGDFSVTKVFKPLLQRDYGDEVISKFVFDVTPIAHIVMGDPVLKVLNESGEEIKLLQSSLFVFYEYKGLGELDYSYYVSVDQHKSFWGPLDGEKSGYLYGVFKAFPKTSLKVKVGACENGLEVEEIDETSVECERAKAYFVEAEGPFVPLSLLTGSYVLKLPRIVIEEASYQGGRVRVRIKNLGERADEVIVLVYTLGTPLARERLGPLSTGEEVQRELEVKVSKGMVGLNVRVIWIKANVRRIVEKFIPL